MISRRRFLGISAASATALLVSPTLLAAQDTPIRGECFLIGEGPRGNASLFGLAPYSSRPGAVRVCRFGQNKIQEITLPFFPHAFAPNPNVPYRVTTFEKWGRHLAEIDLATMTVLRVTQGKAGRRFFGHGAHSGRFIYATQMDDEGGRGLVSVMESDSHKVVNEFETQGAFPHDCQWLPGTGTLVVVNSRQSSNQRAQPENFSSLVWLDAQSGKCLKQQFIETERFGYAHLAQSADGYMVLSGSYDSRQEGSQPLLAVINPDGSVQELDIARGTQKRLQGEVLSLCLDEYDAQVTVTLPNVSRIQAWNYRTGKFLGQVRVNEPRGLAYSRGQRKLVASSAQTRDLLMLDKALTMAPFAPAVAGTGSHLYRLEL